MYGRHTVYDHVAADAAPGSFPPGVRQFLAAGARGPGERGARRRIPRRRAGVELPRRASGTARQCVAHRGPAGTAGGTTWRPVARRGRGVRARPGALRRRLVATPLPALLSEILQGRVRRRTVQPGALALLQ